MENKKIFFESILNTIGNMDLTNVKPYTETEIQPLYSKYWGSNVVNKYLQINPKDITRDLTINPSTLRSMLVMDLYDIIDVNFKTKIFNWYDSVLNNWYNIDKYSLHSNIHNYININELNDYSYFSNTDENNILIINKLLQISYKKNQDIYADNTYEILGSYKLKYNQCIINRFHSILGYNTIDIVVYFDKHTLGIVDMFGHSTYQYKDAKYTIIVNNDVNLFFEKEQRNNLLDQLTKYYDELEIKLNDIQHNIHSRCIRYDKFLDINQENIYDIVYNKKIKTRITNTSILINKLKY